MKNEKREKSEIKSVCLQSSDEWKKEAPFPRGFIFFSLDDISECQIGFSKRKIFLQSNQFIS